jgi:acetolactate synthase-1/2/3 large subunit
MKVSDYIAKFIAKHSSHIFVGQGGNIIHLLDSCSKLKKITVIPSQNEQAAAIAADAYSRFNNKIGFTAVTSGPGMINLMQGIACSYFDSIPTFHFSGAVVTSQIRENKKIRQVGFQEMEVVDLVKPITKYAVLLKNKNMVRYELEKLLYMAKNGRPGPVLMDLPDDIQREFIDPKKLKKFKIPKIKKKKNIFESKFLNLLGKSKKPIVIYGNGIKVSNTEKELKDFIKLSKLPFLPTWACLDIIPGKSEYCAGSFGVAATRFGNFAVQNADLLIVLGSRLPTQVTGSNLKTFAPKAKKIIVDIDSAELNRTKGLKYDLKINLDLKIFFQRINNKIKPNQDYIFWAKNFKKWKDKYPVCQKIYFKEKKFVNPYVFIKKLSNLTGKNDILIPDASANLIWAMQAFEFNGQKIFTSLNHSPMGYSMPATVGAFYANKNKRITCIIGDCSMQMNIQELATISHFKIPAKIIVINNSGMSLIKQTQETWLKSSYVGVDNKSGLAMPNLLNIANAYEIETCTIKNNNEIEKKIKYLLSRKKPIYCEVLVSDKQRVVPKLESGRAIHDLSPLLSRKEMNLNMIND